jgi:hypothetical protein
VNPDVDLKSEPHPVLRTAWGKCNKHGGHTRCHVLFVLLAFLTFFTTPTFASNLTLDPPIACTFGTTCWIQQYPDHDQGPGASDYTCGAESYDGHDGTDIRIRSTADHADVVASAEGIVRGLRDGVPDRLMKTPTDKDAVANIECGNGVVIDHDGGWETQYCHMRQGSVVVKKGERIARGQKLGEVGYSGAAAFPHVHLSVRKDGRKIDPFSGAVGETCGGKNSLWSAEAQKQLAYDKDSLVDFGFASRSLTFDQLENGSVKPENPKTDWPALVTYIWLINLSRGDEIHITLEGPQGMVSENRQTLDRNKAQYFLFAGKKAPAGGWPKGTYSATVTITNAGKPVQQKTISAEME